jgi:hypothetical protein
MGGGIFAPEHLPDVSPHCSGFLQLTVNRLNIVIILQEQAPQIFKYLDLFQHIPLDRKLLLKGQCQCYHHLPLLFPFNPYQALL